MQALGSHSIGLRSTYSATSSARPCLRRAGGLSRAGLHRCKHLGVCGQGQRANNIPLGFRSKAAEAGVRFNGFYLFQASLIERDKITVERKSEEPWRACAPHGYQI